ncbi:MAG: hypothetical protein TU36_003710 [Vulcanisaeta sp. AZ3]|jgi:hypothetical protein|nr:MAG: hypothetical protein TU36_07955 [Vulcanisaeta sp. AZ3]
MNIIDRITEELEGRGFSIVAIHDDSIKAALSRFRIKVWLAPDYPPLWTNPLEMIEKLELEDINAIFVVSERPYVISDYIVNNLSKAHYWFGKELNVKVYSININKLEEDLEDGINLAITNNYREASNVLLKGDACPKCGRLMTIFISSRYLSHKWKTWVDEHVEVCEQCNIVLHRLVISQI